MPHRYVFRVDFENEERREAFIKNWREGSALIQTRPGARGTKLHSMKDTTSLLAIAEWDSKPLRDEAMRYLQESDDELAQEYRAMSKNEDFGTVTLLGEIDETDFVPPNHE